MYKLKNILARLVCASAIAALVAGFAATSNAEETKAPAPVPTLEQRVAGLEAYLTNSDPTVPLKTAKDKDGNPAIPDGLTTPSVGTSGPGHNAWMMTSSALVLFMTLPGLALFYGGLVRRKNVLSVLAQCLGIAGLVTILWWAVGYSLVFASGTIGYEGATFLGGLKYAFLKGVGSAPNTLFLLGIAQRLLDVSIDVRHHHPGAHHRRHRRAHALYDGHDLRHRLDVHRLFPAGPHGMGH